tara:strand:+ start:19716 stop:20861 length:1146 start_codon:yes stop_codon:yes gene_type:complete
MDNIALPEPNFDFASLTLEPPMPLHGGSFFTKINYQSKGMPLYIQLPKCVSKNGIVKNTSTKKPYVDLQFNYFETDLLTWFENLEHKCRELIHDKKETWFQTEMSMDDIENMFISPGKSYKSGKFLIVRTHIPVSKNIKQEGCLIYDENERTLDSSVILDSTQFIPLVHIEGIKFSAKSFQLEINIRQMMVLSMEDSIKKSCMIKYQQSSKINNTGTLENLSNPTTSTSSTINEPIISEPSDIEVVNVTSEKSTENTDSTLEKEVEPRSNITEDSTSLETTIQEDNKQSTDQVTVVSKDTSEPEELSEVNLDISGTDDSVSLKSHKEVYLELYKNAYQKAKQIKNAALEAYLEAQNIKLKYNLTDILPSDDELSTTSGFED